MLNFLDRLKIRKKLLLLIFVLIFGIIITSLISRQVLQTLRINGRYYEQIVESKDIIADVHPARLDINKAYLLSFLEANETDPQKLSALIDNSESFFKEFEEMAEAVITKIPQDMMNESLYKSIYLTREFAQIWHTQFLPAIQKHDPKEIQNLLNGTMRNLYDEQEIAIDKALNFLDKKNQALIIEVERDYNLGRLIAFISWLLMLSFTCLMALKISRSITNRLNSALIQITSVSTEINFRMDQQAQSISQQSNSAHRTTLAMNELNSSFEHTRILAQESSARSKNALKVSEEGNNLIKEMLEGMLGHKEKVLAILNQILHLSEVINRIHQVASTINNLTNQTNILALNAAVQAAHVKQNGEGFSVIATEIRKLADESKKFVSHINQLTENIKQATDSTIRIAEEGNQTVLDSIKLAQSSSKAFDTIIFIATNSFESAQQVSLNIEQQSQAVHGVLETMEILNESAHQNLNDMQQVKAELEKLNQLSEELKTIV